MSNEKVFDSVDKFMIYAQDKLENSDAVGVGLGSRGKRLIDCVVAPYNISGYFYDDDLHIFDSFIINVRYGNEESADRTIKEIREFLNL